MNYGNKSSFSSNLPFCLRKDGLRKPAADRAALPHSLVLQLFWTQANEPLSPWHKPRKDLERQSQENGSCAGVWLEDGPAFLGRWPGLSTHKQDDLSPCLRTTGDASSSSWKQLSQQCSAGTAAAPAGWARLAPQREQKATNELQTIGSSCTQPSHHLCWTHRWEKNGFHWVFSIDLPPSRSTP